MRKMTSFSIRAKMITIVAGSLLLAILSATYMMRGLVYQNIVDQKKKTVDILTASLAHDIKYEYDSQTGNYESIKDVISKYMTYYRIIESISFYDSGSYTNVADSDPKRMGTVTQDREIVMAVSLATPSLKITRFDRSNFGIRSIFPILRGSRMIGAIVMNVSIHDIKTILSAIDRRIATIATITILAASTALFILLRETILRRLSGLMEMTRQIAAGNYDLQLKDTWNDELGELAKAFDQMTSELRKSKQELSDYNQHLEAKVSQATAQLNQAYDDLKNTQSQLVLNEKMASLGVLIAGIAHEINTPVGAMHNVARNLEQRISSLPQVLEAFKKDPDIITDNLPLANCLQDLIQASVSSEQQVASFKDIRAVESLLKNEGISSYKKMTSVLAQLNFMNPDRIRQFIHLLKNQALFSLLESVGAISQAIKIVETSSLKIGEIVRALKYYAYTDKDKIEMIQLNESIKTALILLNNKLKHKVMVTADLDPDLQKIPCTSEVHQIWTNLLNNACDAVEAMGEREGGRVKGEGGRGKGEGGVGERSEGQRYAGAVSISTRRVDDKILVTVTDNGTGIPQDKIGKIFDPFFTTKDIGKGTGLGLSIVSGIIKKHNGTIRVESKVGRTVFEVTFPISAGNYSGSLGEGC